jgi:glycosyltransferase involved in cell wall biosynthesis
MPESKNTIVILADWFDPAWKAGGPVRSLVNLVGHLYQEYDFKIICGDTDYGDSHPIEGLVTDKWVDWNGKAKVYYISKANLSRRFIFSMLDEVSADVIYVQGVFSLYFSIHPVIWWQQARCGKLVIAPRGMLHRSALNIKGTKKRAFLMLAKLMGWFNNAHWHSTNKEETEEIKLVMGRHIQLSEASNFPLFTEEIEKPIHDEGSGPLRLLCISRISDEKNPLLLIEALSQLDIAVELTFAGDYRDEGYFKKFNKRIEQLPGHVHVNYLGAVQPEALPLLYLSHDLFVFPSRGENFGHAIAESLMHGLPVIIGGNTPWNAIEAAGAGFVVQETPEAFSAAIFKYSKLDAEARKNMSANARMHVNLKLQANQIKEDYEQLFYVEIQEEEIE